MSVTVEYKAFTTGRSCSWCGKTKDVYHVVISGGSLTGEHMLCAPDLKKAINNGLKMTAREPQIGAALPHAQPAPK
jgi:hypothetical protein